MAERDLQKLSRAELIEIIYALKVSQQRHRQENQALRQELNRRQAAVRGADSIAEACMELHGVYAAAEAAAKAYLEGIRAAMPGPEAYSRRLRARADEQAGQIIEEARREADRITKEAEQAVRAAAARADAGHASKD